MQEKVANREDQTHVLAPDNARARFARFSSARSECPLCGSNDVIYDFVLQRIAFSQCSDCRLLLGTQGVASVSAATGIKDAPVTDVLAAVHAYAGKAAASVAIVGSEAGARVGGIEVRLPSAIGAGERFEAILVAGGVGGSDPLDTMELLKNHLEPGGTIAFMLPSTSSNDARRERNRWRPLLSSSRYYFNPDNLQLLATRAGLGDFVTYVDARDVRSAPGKVLAAYFRSNFVLLARPVVRSPQRTLSVIFPVFNEKATVVESLTRVIEKDIPGVDMEIVVVESNSTDGSRALVEKFRDHPKVRLVFEDRPRGKGYAVRTGLKHATGEVVLFQDADLEYDVRDYDALVAPLFEMRRNFVLGSRHNPKGASWKIREFADQPLVATIANLAHQVLLAMFNVIYKQRLVDPFTMYKVFRRDCLYGLSFECNRFDFDFEINIMLLRKGYQPIEIPINYLSRSFSEGKKVSFFGDPPTWVRAMLKLRRSPLYRGLAPRT